MDSARDKGSEATKYRLAKAMEECMRTQSVEAVTVTNIAENCGDTRQTFYRNFHDTNDHINWYFGKLLARSFEHMAAADHRRGLERKFEYIRGARVLHRRLPGRRHEQPQGARLRGHHGLLSRRHTKKTGAAPTEDERFALELYCRGSVAMTVKWVLGGMREAPREMSRRLVAALPEQLSELFARLSFL
ncbi:MAG: TetR family transcriptional regulator [Oscillospiraceae bacterium]